MDLRRPATSWRAGGVRRSRLFLKREDVQQLAGQSTVHCAPAPEAGRGLPEPTFHLPLVLVLFGSTSVPLLFVPHTRTHTHAQAVYDRGCVQVVPKLLKFGHLHKSNFKGGERFCSQLNHTQSSNSLGSGIANTTGGNYEYSTSENQSTFTFVSDLKELPGNNA